MEVVYEDCKFWISKDGKILRELGGFIDPVSPQVIIEEIKDEI
jgi:hypothetical protein